MGNIKGSKYASFPDIGGAGEMIYTAVRFSGYTIEYDYRDPSGYFSPIVDENHLPTAETDYNIKGQDILFSLTNMYHILNRGPYPNDRRQAVLDWCVKYMHPFNTVELTKLIHSSGELTQADFSAIRKAASFSLEEFFDELDKLYSASFYFHALKKAKEGRDTYLARSTYTKGNYREGLPFFEKYKRLGDEEYLKKIDEDYPVLLENLLYLVPKFQMSLALNDETGKVGLYSHIDSVFDIAWFALMRIIAKDAPPSDSDDERPLYSSDPYICCNACGRYVKRRCPRQKYCDNSDCQRLRKRRNQKDFYDRAKEKKIKKDVDDRKEENSSL